MLIATGLVPGNDGRLVPDGGYIAERFAEATLAEFVGAAEEVDRIVDAERGKEELHRPIMLVAQRQDVGPHGPILALRAKRNRRR
jgi:hypothetical protein